MILEFPSSRANAACARSAPWPTRSGLGLLFLFLFSALSVAQAPFAVRTGAPGEELGRSLAVGPDLDGDGVRDLAVGMPGATSGAGALSIRSGDSLDEIQRFEAATYTTTVALDRFGEQVTTTADLDSDGFEEWLVLVRAGGDAIVLTLSSANGAELQRTTVSADAAPFDTALITQVSGGLFGWVLPRQGGVFHYGFSAPGSASALGLTTLDPPGALSPMATQAGTARFAVGLDREPFGSADLGEVRVHNASAGGPSAPLWALTGTGPLDRLGAAITGVGDLDGDGDEDLAVGAPGIDTVLLLSGIDGTEIRRLQGAEMGSDFGAWLSFGLDRNGDGLPDLAVRAPNASGSSLDWYDPRTGAFIASSAQNSLPQSATSTAVAGDIYGGRIDHLFGDASEGLSGEGVLAGFEWTPRPGTGDGLVLRFGDFGVVSRNTLAAVWGGEPVRIRVDAEDAALHSQPFFMLAQVWPTGGVQGPAPFSSAVWIDVLRPFVNLTQQPLPVTGYELAFPAVQGLEGASVIVQAAVADGSPGLGIRTTNALEIVHRVCPIIYVDRQNGSPSATGYDPNDPLDTIQAGINASRAFGDPALFVPYPKVFVASGVYLETPVIDFPVEIVGGYDASTWTRNAGDHSLVRTAPTGWQVSNIASAAKIEGFGIQADNATSTSVIDGASIAMVIRGAGPDLVITDCTFRSGDGMSGGRGGNGIGNSGAGSNGGSGSNGTYTLSTGPGGSGGSGGTTGSRDGGSGGAGGRIVCESTIFGACASGGARGGAGGSTGSGGTASGGGGSRSTCGRGGSGGDGTDGMPGGTGSGGSLASSLMGAVTGSGTWTSVRGGTGSSGATGLGGGGGGGGGAGECAQQFVKGGGGGGGGSGGGGGRGGTGGHGGGASFGIFLWNASPTFDACAIASGQGGRGGDGGNGSDGAPGGSGGPGGTGVNVTVAGAGLGSGDGGNGGDGGDGGSGGGGGGGHGGPSFCVVQAGASAPSGLLGASVQLSPGTGGPGGTGGASGSSGQRAASGQTGPSGDIGQL